MVRMICARLCAAKENPHNYVTCGRSCNCFIDEAHALSALLSWNSWGSDAGQNRQWYYVPLAMDPIDIPAECCHFIADESGEIVLNMHGKCAFYTTEVEACH